MDLPAARIVAPQLEVVDTVGSTNAELVRRERAVAQPHLTVLATLDQSDGRGRLGRTWSAEPGASLAVSVVIRPGAIPMERLGLLTLLGGLAARDAVAALLPERRVEVKWPNDVLVGGRKIVGVLAELVPETGAVVLGAGINIAMTEAQRPVPTATSVAIETGAPVDPVVTADRALAGYLASLGDLVARLESAAGDLDRAGLREGLEAACGTLGARVAVERPDGTRATGRAVGLGPDGSLEFRADGSDEVAAILAGDVTHLRYQ